MEKELMEQIVKLQREVAIVKKLIEATWEDYQERGLSFERFVLDTMAENIAYTTLTGNEIKKKLIHPNEIEGALEAIQNEC